MKKIVKVKRDGSPCVVTPEKPCFGREPTSIDLELKHREGYKDKPLKPEEFSIWEEEQTWPEDQRCR
jgi:hypothetical protein